MSFIKDVFLGGAEKKAAKAETEALKESQGIIKESTAEARQDATRLFGQAQESAQLGQQGALDVFGQTIPQQGQVFQQGNVAAQQALLSGLPQIQNAILGNQVDFSQLQPTTLDTDFSFAQQQLPQFQGINETLNPQPTEQQIPNFLGGQNFLNFGGGGGSSFGSALGGFDFGQFNRR